MSSSSSSPFRSLGNLLDPTPEDIARNAEYARQDAEERARAEEALKALAEWKARLADPDYEPVNPYLCDTEYEEMG
jgi:hypothetical protein